MKIFLKELFIKPLNTMFICIGLIISIYCLSIGTSLFNTNFNFLNDKNYIFKENFIAQFGFKEKISIKDFVSNIEEIDNDNGFLTSKFILEKGERINYLTGVYNYKNLNNIYPLLDGRYFTNKESISNEKIALVGSEILDLTYIKNGYKYIDIDGESFQVIGIIGRKTLSYWGIQIIVPVKSLPKKFYNSKNENIEIFYPNNMLKQHKYFDDLKNVLKNQNIDEIRIEKVPQESVLNKVYDNNKAMYVSLIFSILLSLISIFTFSTFWSDGLKRNIAIKKILGANNLYIFREVVCQMLILVAISSIIASGLNIITLKFLEKVFIAKVTFNLINMISITIATFFITMLNSLWIYKDIFNFDVLDYIK
ncbi:ABC transporter permease [Clostridium sp. L74]|uniref:ABC transporter permease n=1 Tax=Clostridium sp. L74 TaxID=1560217 RepID=UPI0006ABD2BD|nr:ABC transporter permease [Clostridium sp. L74]KOR25400.1 hypothetical protein ND00_17060 [Clostridium sp. L74]